MTRTACFLLVVAFALVSGGCATTPATPETLATAEVRGTAPADLKAQLGDAGFADLWNVDVTWSPIDDAVGYEVQRHDSSQADDLWSTVSEDTLSSEATSATDRYVGYDATLWYRVRAVLDASNATPWSSSWRVEIPKGDVLYEVEGTAASASITMSTASGTEQADIDLPLTTKSGEVGLCLTNPIQHPYISAQNKGRTGTVTCRITVRGVVESENTSSGAYAIATCSS
ncbi:hypothetical protein HP550_17490 [Cellulomonas humilata]|uniref:Fibronectin type-III domain-containing protein n=1 Tax=Cellulomonas humilata TaxID=144055 RepID=A0A7Y6DZ39_9CELL|nr:MmpS family transport accessory protein [Cellulomonas humilata]NUU19045.1 hypothetical protein [Cellulomonas humilata]